ncbi:hypothetical protein Dip518_001569 [Parelusimicrobium proximum]|uniref:hypothetical protein n=1 Tax=Parelusimicrobium proximum TaxID=3228953 RepID=UPI003D16E5E5
MKKYIVLIVILCSFGCNAEKGYKKDKYYKGKTKEYHIACSNRVFCVDCAGINIDGDTLEYFGKIRINIEDGTILCDCLESNETINAILTKSFSSYKKKGFSYSLLMKEKEKLREDDTIKNVLLPSTAEWKPYLFTIAPYNSLDFWSRFEQKGLFLEDKNINIEKRCLPIDKKTGDLYFKNKWKKERKKTELANAFSVKHEDMHISVRYEYGGCSNRNGKMECHFYTEEEIKRYDEVAKRNLEKKAKEKNRMPDEDEWYI